MPTWKGNSKWVVFQTKKDTSVGLNTAEQRESLTRNGGGRLAWAKQHTCKGLILLCPVLATSTRPPVLLSKHCFLRRCCSAFLAACELKMRVDRLQLFGILLLLSGCCGSAASSACKSFDENSKSGGKIVPSYKKVVCSNMELHQVLPPDSLSFPNRTVTLWVHAYRCMLWKHIPSVTRFTLFSVRTVSFLKVNVTGTVCDVLITILSPLFILHKHGKINISW